MKLFMVPALILIVGSLIVPLLKGISRKVYIMLLPALAFLTILLMKPGTVIKTNFLTGFKLTLVKADWISLTVGLALHHTSKKDGSSRISPLVYRGNTGRRLCR